MARYSPGHKGQTRQRIIESAGRRFKRDGIDGAGIAAIMSDAELTNGAFYAHFTSKDDLVASVVADQMDRWRTGLDSSTLGPEALGEFVRAYLSARHRDHPDTGCPSAALLEEIARCDKAARRAYATGLQEIIATIGGHLSPRDPAAARTQAIGLLTVLIATMQLARAVPDRRLSDEILEAGIRNAQNILDSAQREQS